ncbi:hypothetical protein WA026_017540 [Henosepilachna vigintioctopunctata]|uniref:Uncharacterized protein n=1 Tax=Henosepilachna vigintioctopunctata TaxID=420089 RepID=A0AAW1UZU0_9CUCU
MNCPPSVRKKCDTSPKTADPQHPRARCPDDPVRFPEPRSLACALRFATTRGKSLRSGSEGLQSGRSQSAELETRGWRNFHPRRAQHLDRSTRSCRPFGVDDLFAFFRIDVDPESG